MTSAVSADWVLPVDGPPIEQGVVRFDHGRIVEVAPGRAERHFPEAAIAPGFVNAHTHLEYANYAGFADGMQFGPWIKTHIARKARLEFQDMLAVARLGALESLRSGATTVADYSFSGATAAAADELGLRAIVNPRSSPSTLPTLNASGRTSEPSSRRRRSSASASRRTRRTPARSRRTGSPCHSACLSARTSPRAQTRRNGCSTDADR